MKTLPISLTLLLAALASTAGCETPQEGGDTQTNWLKDCTADDECGGLQCLCGRCTTSCSAAEDCSATPVASVCQPEDSQGAQAFCGDSAPLSVCLSSCSTKADCAGQQQCVGGACMPSPADSTGAAVLDFCSRWMARWCAHVEACGCGAEAAQQCELTLASTCEPDGFIGSLASAVDAGDLVFDPQAADAFLARYDEPDPLCVEDTFRDLQLDSLEVYSLAGTFLGTHELGSACTLPVGYKGGVSDCREGLCAPDDAGGGKCIALARLGEPCDASGDDDLTSTTARLCFDLRPSDGDGEYESAFDSLSCVPSAQGATTLICSRGLENGQPCNDDEACQSQRCMSTDIEIGECAPKLADGEMCSAGGDCLSGACDGATEPAQCSTPLADGMACSYDDSACDSGSCNDTDDGGGGTCGPPATAAIGEACGANYECVTETCRRGLCFADICGDYLN
jgi:hypothetical protein